MRRSGGYGEGFPRVLAAAQQGEGWAFQRLFAWLGGPVAAYLRGAGAEDPDSLANDVFLRAFTGLGRFRGEEGPFRSWVFAIAHNVLLDDVRRRHRRVVSAPLDDRSVGVQASPDTPETSLEQQLADDAVRSMLSRLAPDQRDVLLLRLVADLSVEQTAAALGKSTGAVKALQHRAIASLRRTLESREAVSR